MSETEMSGVGPMRGCPLWAKALLVASLAVNLGVAGMVGGWMLREPHDIAAGDTDAGAEGLDRGQVRLLRLVPESHRAEAREFMLAQSDQIAMHRQRVVGIHREMAATMRSPDFTADDLRAKLAARRVEMNALFGVLQEQMVAIVVSLTPAERAAMAESFENFSKRWEERSASR